MHTVHALLTVHTVHSTVQYMHACMQTVHTVQYMHAYRLQCTHTHIQYIQYHTNTGTAIHTVRTAHTYSKHIQSIHA